MNSWSRLLISVISVILVIIGLFMASSPFYSPVRYTTTIPVTTTIVGVPTTLTATIQTKDTVVLKPQDCIAIENPKSSLWAWPEDAYIHIIVESPLHTSPVIATYQTTGTELLTTTVFHTIPAPVTTTVEVRGKTYVYYHGETYIPSESRPVFIGRVVSDGPINFMVLDEKNFLKYRRHSSYEAIYMKADIVGSSEVSFIPPPRRDVKGSRIYLVFCNYGSTPAHLSYEFKVLREVAKQYATTQYEAIETQRYELTKPEMTLGIIIFFLAIILLLISTAKPREKTSQLSNKI